MQLKMQEILGFASFYDIVKTQKLSIKTAYRLTTLAKAIENELQFYREKLQSIIQEYGEFDDNGQPVTTDDGGGIKLRHGVEEQCFAAMRELQEVEVTLPDIKFNLDDFGSIELSTNEIGAILPFVEE
jgi:hypothetical protein